MRITALPLALAAFALPAQASEISVKYEEGVKVYRGSPINPPRPVLSNPVSQSDVFAYVEHEEKSQDCEISRALEKQSDTIDALERRLDRLERPRHNSYHPTGYYYSYSTASTPPLLRVNYNRRP